MRVVLVLLLLVLALVLTWPAPAPAAEGPEIRVLAGGLVGLMTNGEPQVDPLARIDVGWGIYGEDRPIRAHVLADLTALPGQAIDVADVSSFRALEFKPSLSWKPVEAVAAAIYAGAGFATRLDSHGNEPTPLYQAPKFASFGVLFEEASRASWLQMGMGPDQRLDGRYVLALQVDGGLDLLRAPEGTRLEGTALALMVSAVLGLEHSPTAPGRRDVVRVGVCLAWGR